jgi:hypothetical protein
MFDWGQIWTVRRPIEWVNVMIGEKTWQTLATWGWALSCWKIRWCCCTNGTATGRRISSLYLTPVKLPAITINGNFSPWDIPPQTITEPPPNLSLSRTQVSAKRSPRRRPSGRKRVNRCPRDTGRVADRLRVMTPRQDRTIHLAHLQNRHVTATETTLTKVGNHNCHIHPKAVRNRLCDLTLVFLSLVHVAHVIWLGWQHMVPDNFQWGNGRHYAQTVGNPSSISRTTDKTLYGGKIHTKLQSNLLPLTLH